MQYLYCCAAFKIARALAHTPAHHMVNLSAARGRSYRVKSYLKLPVTNQASNCATSASHCGLWVVAIAVATGSPSIPYPLSSYTNTTTMETIHSLLINCAGKSPLVDIGPTV